nr:ATP-binding protein [uncultured Roseateles sp.]
MRLPRSLQGRLLVTVLAAVTLIWLATAVLTWLDARHELDELLDGHLAQAAALLVVQQAHELDEGDTAVDAPSLHRYAPKVAFQVFHEGRLAQRSANAPAEPMVRPGSGFRTGFDTVLIAGADWRVFAAYGAERDIQVYVGEQRSSRAAILRAVLRGLLWPLLLALPLLALLVAWAVHRGVAPLRRLGAGLAQRQAQALHPVTLDGAPTEMRPMIAALNGLFERIAQLLEAERRFTADAAHELRTPIAAIRAQAQVAMGEGDAAPRRLALQHLLEGCDRATRLVEQLLTLARLEAQALPDGALAAEVDLAALARQVLADLAPRAAARRQTLELDADADAACRLPGEPTLLAVLLRNLVDNALRYSPAGARVVVTLAAPQGRVRLSVEDSGPGLAEADRRRLGERFFRAIGSGESGSGLGWSIVQRIAAAHGLLVQIEASAALGGLAVRVQQPG